jgi:hypothetical protein
MIESHLDAGGAPTDQFENGRHRRLDLRRIDLPGEVPGAEERQNLGQSSANAPQRRRRHVAARKPVVGDVDLIVARAQVVVVRAGVEQVEAQIFAATGGMIVSMP